MTRRQLLLCGVVAGPFFLIVGLMQAVTIPGFDLTHHYLSLLESGELGWIQRANFMVSGALSVAAAIGMRRTLQEGRGGIAGPLLIAAYGVGFISAGVFVPDPALGFPPGTLDAIPDHVSWHSAVHGVAAIVAFLCLDAACLTFAYRFVASRDWAWVAFSVATAMITFALPAIPSPWGGVLLFIASAIGWGWLLALSRRLLNAASM
jgi:hypothetical membrane protein